MLRKKNGVTPAIVIDENSYDWREHRKEIINYSNKSQIAYDMKWNADKKKREAIDYYSAPFSFDIETSTWATKGKDHHACLTCWQFGLNGKGYIGRTWEEFDEFLEMMKEGYGLSEKRRLPVYVHNLKYEFQWLRGRYRMEEVFATGSRNPVRALMADYGIELRDSLILTGMNLANTAKNLHKYKVEKTDGWDYKKVRTTGTTLSKEEREYAVHDVLVVQAAIQERLDDEGGDITKIPMTRTGYVRRDCRKHTIEASKKYKEMVQGLTLTPDEYATAKRAFQGGFTHASHKKAGRHLKDCGSYDFTSSYPAWMASQKFPMRGYGHYDNIELDEVLACKEMGLTAMFDISLKNVSGKFKYEHMISESKCTMLAGEVIDNGRIKSADHLKTTITDIDLQTLLSWYNYDELEITNCYIYYADYLPKELVERVLYYYRGKTELKGVEGEEVQYALCKERVNAIYGMMVMDIIRDEFNYKDGKWEETVNYDIDGAVDKYNNDKKRFTSYLWGVWITAHARRHLMMGIEACGENYIYSDTDSIKYLNRGSEDFCNWVNKFNNEYITDCMEGAMEHHGFPKDYWKPKSKDGKEKPLGFWDPEKHMTDFKTLGAKRYLVTYDDGKLSATVAGAPKSHINKYLSDRKDPYKVFTNGLVIPASKSGKNCSEYIDEMEEGFVTDYQGVTEHYLTATAIALYEIPFQIKMSETYMGLIGLQFIEGVV